MVDLAREIEPDDGRDFLWYGNLGVRASAHQKGADRRNFGGEHGVRLAAAAPRAVDGAERRRSGLSAIFLPVC